MCIVELNGDFLRQLVPIFIAPPETPHQVSQRTSDQKKLLYESQALPHARRVIRIKNPSQGFCRQHLGDRTDKVAMAEHFEIDVILRRGRPQSKSIDALSPVTDHWPVERHADQF